MRIATKPQQRLLRAIVELTSERGFPPTVRELAEETGVTNTAIFDCAAILSRRGWIAREHRIARSIRLTPAGWAQLSREARRARSPADQSGSSSPSPALIAAPFPRAER